MSEEFTSAFAESVRAAMDSALDTMGWAQEKITAVAYDTTRERSLLVMFIHSLAHQVSDLNDILCKLDGEQNAMTE